MRQINFSGSIDCLFVKKKKSSRAKLFSYVWLLEHGYHVSLSFSLSLCMDFFEQKKINKRSNKDALGLFCKL